MLAELVVVHRGAGKAKHRKAGVEQFLASQVKDRRQELAYGEIARSAKDDEQTRWRGAFHPDSLQSLKERHRMNSVPADAKTH